MQLLGPYCSNDKVTVKPRLDVHTIIDLIVCRDGSVSSEDVMELLRPYCSVIVKPRLDVLHNNRSDCL